MYMLHGLGRYNYVCSGLLKCVGYSSHLQLTNSHLLVNFIHFAALKFKAKKNEE